MGWKNWSYWLRGGFLLATIYFIYTLLINQLYGTVIKAGLYRILYEVGYPFNFVRFLVMGFNESFIAIIFSWIIAYIVFFLLGAIIGWIVGKIKSK
ncbi:hypothetical protein J4217_04200 [Candidatus Pacearchaeota archaeon]|nr:hypothetical protein [Candidatus Pacearchaeota archaeon]